MSSERPVYTVTQVNSYLKAVMDQDRLLSGLFVRGEISNFKTYPSGHSYFSLKDEGGASAASCSGGRPPGSASDRRTG